MKFFNSSHQFKEGTSLIEVVMVMAVISLTILVTMNILISGLNSLANLSRIQLEQKTALNIIERVVASQYSYDQLLEQSLRSLTQSSINVRISGIEEENLILETYFDQVDQNSLCQDLTLLQLQQIIPLERSEQVCFLGSIQRPDQGSRLTMNIRSFTKSINQSQSFNVILNEI